MNKSYLIWGAGIVLAVIVFLGVKFFSEESQNNFNKFIDTSYGFKHGQVDILAGHEKPVRSWLGVEKLTTPKDKEGNDKNYRFSYGYYDANHNGKIDISEKKVGKRYFEIGPYTMYIFMDTGINQYSNQ